MYVDLFIESLTGSAFKLRVSPYDTVMSIKTKIQRVEGIPVSQQHLIWRDKELIDHLRLRDNSVPAGATLKLVLGMRGGPLNAYRPPTLRIAPLHFSIHPTQPSDSSGSKLGKRREQPITLNRTTLPATIIPTTRLFGLTCRDPSKDPGYSIEKDGSSFSKLQKEGIDSIKESDEKDLKHNSAETFLKQVGLSSDSLPAMIGERVRACQSRREAGVFHSESTFPMSPSLSPTSLQVIKAASVPTKIGSDSALETSDKRLTLFVFKDGDHLNFLQVLDEPWHSNSSESSLDKNANFNDVAELPSAPSEKNCSDNSVLHDFKSLDNHSSFIHSQATRWSAPALTSTASASTNEFSSCRPLHTPLGQCLPTFKENASEICGPEPSSDLESQLSSSRLSDVCLASNGFAGSLKSESSDVSNIYDLEHDTSKIKPYFQVPSTKSIFLNNCDAVNSSNSRSSKELKLADNCSKTDFHNPHKVLSFEPRSRPHTASSIDLFPEHSANVGSPYQAEVESDESSSTCGTLSIHDNERVNDTASSISSAYAFLAGLLAAASGRKAIKTNLESNFKEACSSENNRYAYPYHWLRPPNAFLNRLSPKTSNSRWRYSTSNGSREEGSFPSSSHCSNISFRSTCSDQNLAVSSRDNLAADWRHRNSRSFAIPRDCLAEEEEEEDETEAEHSLEINIEDVSGKLDDDPEGDDACASNGICDDDGDDDNDDDSLADLDDYLLYYRTGDLLFGPPSSVSLTAGDYSNCPPPQSPHVSLGDFDSLSFPGLRAVGLSGNAYAQYRSHFGEMLTNQDDPVSAHTASSFVSPWRQECSQLAEKVHSLKSRMNEVKLRRERRREEFRRHAECEDALLTKESHKRLPPIKSEETSAPAHISNVIERSNSDNSSSTTLATRISNNNVTVIPPGSLDVERSNTDQRPFTSHLYSRMEGADLILKRFSLPGRLKPVSLEATSSVPVSDSNAWKQLSRGRIQRPLTPIVPPTARPSTPVYPGQKTLYLGSNAASAKASLMTSSSSGTPSFRQENLAPGQFLSDTSHSQEPTSPEPESHSSQGQNGLENSVCDLPNSIDPHLRISSINDVKPSAAKSSGSRPALDRRRRFGTVQQPASLLEISAMAAAEAAVTASIGVTTCESPLAPPSSETTIVGLDSIGAGTRFCQLSSSPCISPGRPLPPSSASRHLDTRATVLPTSAIHFYQHQKRHLPSPTASAGLLLPLRFTKKPEASAVMAPLATDQTCDKELSKNWTETPGLALPRIPDSLVTGQAPLSGTRDTPLIGGFTTGTSESSSQSTFPLLPRQSSLAKSAAPNLIHSTSLADVASGSASFLLLVDAVRDTTATSQLNSRRHSHVAVTSFGSDACYNSTISTVASSNQPIGKQTRLLLTGPSCQLPMSPLSSNDDCNMSSGRRFIQRTDRATSSWQLDGSPNARTNESDVDRLAEVQTGGTRRRPDKRCHVCSKRTGLANSYTCRCGRNFCAKHRYAELHSCKYDYKADARRYLQEANPVVTASKLPKI